MTARARRPLFWLTIAWVLLLLPLARIGPAAGIIAHGHEGRRVYRAYFQEREQVYALASWQEPWQVNYEAGYLILDANPAEAERLRKAGFRLVEDLAATAAVTGSPGSFTGQAGGIPGFSCYRTVEESFATAAHLATTYPQLATWEDIGDSWKKADGQPDGFDMRVLRLTNSNFLGAKPGLFVMGALHPREYASAEVVTRFGEYLLDNYGRDADVTWLLDYHTIHLLLLGNPDGRKLAEAGFLWRKNVNENYCGVDSEARGADLNRNFPFQWGCCSGASNDACSPVYRGPAPASEPETVAVVDYLKAHFPDQREPALTAAVPVTATGILLDLHSYGEWVLWPWGFTFSAAPNEQALTTLGRRLAAFTDYYPSQAAALYPAEGAVDDFAYGELGIAAYTVEMGTAFFQDCATFEQEIWPDNRAALIYAARTVGAPYRWPAGPQVDALALHPATGDTRVGLTARVAEGGYNDQNGVEPRQQVAGAHYSIDLPPWLPAAVPQSLEAADGSFDEATEAVTVTLDTAALSPGRHTLFVRGQDTDGNWGGVRAIFLDVGVRIYLPAVTN